jgi:hypothetical protein
VLVEDRSKPLCKAPVLKIGNKPIDNGNYIFTDGEKDVFLAIKGNAGAAKYLHSFIGSVEFLNGGRRWILSLQGADPKDLKALPEVLKRIAAVRAFRAKSTDKGTQKLADTPTRFHVENFPKGRYLVVPKVSSERRPYLPLGFLDPNTLCSDLVFMATEATRYHFGVLSSTMHMAWMRTVCGRLESRYRYSAGIVYNCFPWPRDPTPKHVKAIEAAADAVFAARAKHPGNSLADLYDPDTMPPDLARAHAKLDKAVDATYAIESGQSVWSGDLERARFLLGLYQSLVAGPTPWIPTGDKPAASKPKKATTRKATSAPRTS